MAIVVDNWEKLGIVGVLIGGGGMAVRWLLSDRKALLKSLEDSHQRERDLQDKRANELLEQAGLLAQSSEIVREALTDVTQALEALERTVRDHAGKDS